MTKHGRQRNKRKSNSTTEPAVSAAEGSAKIAKEKGAKTGDHVISEVPAAAVKSPHSDSIRSWFSSLSWQDRANVCSIEDKAFVATLLDLAASSSRHHAASHPHVSSSGGGSGTEATWGSKVSIEQIEQTYKAKLVQTKSLRFVPEGKATSILSSGDPTVASATTEGNNRMAAEELKPDAKGSSSDWANPPKGKGDTVLSAAANNGTESVHPTVESDTFRIQEGIASSDATDAQATSTKATTSRDIDATTKEKTDENKKGSFREGYGILDHLRIVFPSAYNMVVIRHGLGFAPADPKNLENPVITLDPRALETYPAEEMIRNLDGLLGASKGCLNKVFLSEEALQTLQRRSSETDEAKPTWIALLKLRAQKSAPLSLLIATRMEAAVLACYKKWSTREADTPVGTNMADALGDGAKERQHVPAKEDATRMSSETLQTFRPFHVAAEAVEVHASRVPSSRIECSLDYVRDLVPEQFHAELSVVDTPFVLLPFSNVLNCKQVITCQNPSVGALMLWNDTLEVALKTLIDDTVEIDCAKAVEVELGHLSITADDVQSGIPLPASGKKTKKKKKKKKRKASNADQSIGSNDLSLGARSAIADESVDELGKRRDGRLPGQKLVDFPCATSTGSKTLPAIVMQTPTDGIDASSSEQEAIASKDFAEEDSHTPDSVATEHKDSVVVPPVDKEKESRENGESASAVSNELTGQSPNNQNPDDSTDDNLWETVKSRNRNRKPCSGQVGSVKPGTHGSSSASTGTTALASKKGKKTRESKKRYVHRKMAKDIISSVLDDVDAEVTRRRSQAGSSLGCRARQPDLLPRVSAWQPKPMTMRDVVLGKLRADADKSSNKSIPAARPSSMIVPSNDSAASGGGKRDANVGGSKKTPAWGVDQLTAPTVPETVSGISSGAGVGEQGSASCVTSEKAVERNLPGDCSSSGVAAYLTEQQNVNLDKKETSPTPPLQTLLGPNGNSASSSVASSLEVPNGRHLHHHHSSVANENEVGYHLLDVCDRLSRDMDVFMRRRAIALIIRRRERGALLAALQDTASKLWAGRCHVETYGSCATQLDLPSSDLDTLICGHDRRSDGPMNASLSRQQSEDQISSPRLSHSQDDMSAAASIASHDSQPDMSHPYSPSTARYMNVPALSPSAERVIRLASELERQPWAVQVKAIPTATVPVVKILADPSRLPGAVSSAMSEGDWMMQQHHIAAVGMSHAPQAQGNQPHPHPQGGFYAPMNAPALGLGQPSHSQYVHHSPPPWRGADVMNGLFKVDITFEGPEHGGIGSTIYSARFVQEACDETGLPPDRTPIVQALMVLKELLAQRRLNEPFSGGLSSYALLLLLDAVLKERRAIQQEMEKIERQRLAVVAGDSNVNVRKDPGRPSCDKEPNGGSGKKAGTPIVTSGASGDSDDAENADLPTSQSAVVAAISCGDKKPAQQRSAVSAAKDKVHKLETTTIRTDVHANKAPGRTANVEAPTSKKPESSLVKKPESSLAKKPESAIVKRVASQTKTASSWASIAKKGTGGMATKKAPPQKPASATSQPESKQTKPQTAVNIGTFAEAVSNSRGKTATNSAIRSKAPGGEKKQTLPQEAKKVAQQPARPTPVKSPVSGSSEKTDPKDRLKSAVEINGCSSSAAVESSSASGSESGFGGPSLFPQGSNDVLEVLCSGETTAGKLLLHFLLYYGRHFDSHSTAIDLSGKHQPEIRGGKRHNQVVHRSPYVPRKGGGSIDPVTGMLTVDPIVVYDPLEGAEENNVAKSCFAWSSIRWVFAQSYMTLSSAVERSGTPPATVGNRADGEASKSYLEPASSAQDDLRQGSADEDVSPLLELLLSF